MVKSAPKFTVTFGATYPTLCGYDEGSIVDARLTNPFAESEDGRFTPFSR